MVPECQFAVETFWDSTLIISEEINYTAMKIPAESLKRSIQNKMEATEIDESGSLQFQAPKNKEGKDTSSDVRERKVSFHSRVRCRRSKTPSITGDKWYSQEEISSFRERDKCLQKFLFRSTSVTGEDDTNDASFIGLNSERDRRARFKRIQEAKACVLGEQLAQEDTFYNDQADLSKDFFELDQETIGDFYSSYSRRATKVARMRGLQVSWHVENLWQVEEDTDIDDSQGTCSGRSSSTSRTGNHRSTRTSSLRSAGGGLIARISTAAA